MSAQIPPQGWGSDPLPEDAPRSPADHYAEAATLAGHVEDDAVDAATGYLGMIAHGVAGLLLEKIQRP